MKWLFGIITMMPLISCVSIGQSAVGTPQRVVVPLEAVVDDRPAPYFSGQTNIFFTPVPDEIRDSVRLASDWMRPEIADVIDQPSLQKIRALRFTTGDDTTRHYVLDTAGRLDFTKGLHLDFERIGELMVAKAPLRVRAITGREVLIPLQVMYAGKYAYARIAEARVGTAQIANRKYAVRVQPRSRNHPFYSTTGGTQFLIDFDSDGVFAKGAARLVDGRPIATEEAQPDIPFGLGNMWYEIESIDSSGSTLILTPSMRTTAVAAGFKPPQFVAEDLEGRVVSVQSDHRQPTLLEFWSTECPFSEAIRESLNKLYESRRGQFAWIAMSRERESHTVAEFIRNKPRSAQVVLGDSATWNRFNPNTVTPLFVLIDNKGTIAFVTSGASALPAIASKLEELLAAKE